MKITKIVRYIGFGLLILSVILLMYLFSHTLLMNRSADSADRYAVLEISADLSGFPQTDYDALYTKMNLVSDFVEIDGDASLQEQQNQISAAALATGSEHVILFAWGNTCIPALSAAASGQGIASVILLSPDLAADKAVEEFGTHKPDVPVAIFDLNTPNSTSLYERLSGEDATLFPGLSDDGLITSKTFITPDGSRYLSQWEIPAGTKSGQTILLFLPQVQFRIGEYISTYITGPEIVQNTDSRAQVATVQIIKVLAAAFLSAGLFLFFASIPKSRREIKDSGSAGGTAVRSVDMPAIDKLITDKTAVNKWVIGKARAGTMLLSALAAFIFTVVLIILFSLDIEITRVILGVWPLVYYAAAAVFLARFFPVSMVATAVPARRLLFSGGLSILFSTGIFIFANMYNVSIIKTYTGLHGLLLALFFLLLFILSWIRMSTDVQARRDKFGESMGNSKYRERFQYLTLCFPYAAVLIFLMVTGRRTLSLQCIFLLAVLLTGIWIRYIFRRTSGTEWLAAITFAAFYSLIAFG